MIAWIIVRIIAGWMAEHITGRGHGLIKNLIVGIAQPPVHGGKPVALCRIRQYAGSDARLIGGKLE